MFLAVRHSSADVGYRVSEWVEFNWAFTFHDATAEILSSGLSQISINRDLPIDSKKSRVTTGQKEMTSELHTLTNLRLSADGFSLCMPKIIAYY